jgi:DNA adenine methylase
MQYFGGKQRIAGRVSEFLSSQYDGCSYYFEPFIGGGSVCARMGGKRFASDKNEYLVAMWRALQDGWLPPTSVSEEEYARVRAEPDKDKALTAFVGFGCSYSGKWFGGYARSDGERNYALNAYNSLMKQLPAMGDVRFEARDFRDTYPRKSLVYCDPPYKGTTGYGAVGAFDTKRFWSVMREWSKHNKVYISEYAAPEDFECVLEIPTKLDIRNGAGEKEQRMERIFTWLG